MLEKLDHRTTCTVPVSTPSLHTDEAMATADGLANGTQPNQPCPSSSIVWYVRHVCSADEPEPMLGKH